MAKPYDSRGTLLKLLQDGDITINGIRRLMRLPVDGMNVADKEKDTIEQIKNLDLIIISCLWSRE